MAEIYDIVRSKEEEPLSCLYSTQSLNMMSMMGYNVGTGLGRYSQGRVNIVEASGKHDRKDFGAVKGEKQQLKKTKFQNCDICGVAVKRNELKVHKDKMHSENKKKHEEFQSGAGSLKETLPKIENSFFEKCEVCGVLINEEKISEHKANMHKLQGSNLGLKACNICDVSVKLTKMKEHQDEMHFKCTICGLHFNLEEKRNVHESKHRNKYQYSIACSQHSDKLEKIVFTGGDIDEFLSKFVPTEVRASEGVGWICIESASAIQNQTDDKNNERQEIMHNATNLHEDKQEVTFNYHEQMCEIKQKEQEEFKEDSLDVMIKEWNALGVERTEEDCHALAKNYQITSGEWMVLVIKSHVNHIWSLVAKGITSGKLLTAKSAKVSSTDDVLKKSLHRHMISISNGNYFDQDEVNQLMEELRMIGIRGKMQYKPDVFTHCGINKNNPWKIKHVLYETGKAKKRKITQATKE